MSDILIRGMEMPSGCFACPMVSGYMLFREGKIEPCVKAGLCRLNRKTEVQIDGRPQDCPLVPVPPHGDLIDKSGVAVLSWYEKDEGDFYDGVLFVLDKLDELPVIIPAEEGE